MNTLSVNGWRIEYDKHLTESMYQKIVRSSSEECNCEECHNFRKIKLSVYPEQINELFKKLGIDSNKEIENYYLGYIDGVHLYAGWFHFVGRIVSKNILDDFIPITDDFSVYFTDEVALASDEYREYPMVQLEFHVKVRDLVNG